MSTENPIDVAIVGGGCAGVAAAFELSRPEHRGRYRVTLYQQGWRLGGKGASGRGPAQRIEEHGLHLWLGFYDNAFRMMRECYRELDRQPGSCPIVDWRDAFVPDSFVGVTERTRDGGWTSFLSLFPARPGAPGDPPDDVAPYSVVGYTARMVQLLRTVLTAVRFESSVDREAGGADCRAPEERAPEDRAPDDRVPDDGAPDDAPPWPGNAPTTAAIVENLRRLLNYGQFAGLTALIEGAWWIEAALRYLPTPANGILLPVVDALTRGARELLSGLADRDVEVRRMWGLADMTLAVIHGLFTSGAMIDPRGLDVLDDLELRDWLRSNGATAGIETAYMRGLYDLVLGYPDGDLTNPSISAAVGIRGSMRMFYGYRGALFWKMQAGMGDVVFAPLYEVLKRRGVRFELFHRLENVRLAPEASLGPDDRPHVVALELDVQARVAGGGDYQPLVDVHGLPCWPSSPDWAQLEDGERLCEEGRDFESWWDRRRVERKELRLGEDFDCVVLAVGLGAIPYVAGEIVERDERWANMVGNVKTVATRALQIWLDEEMEELGWTDPPTNLSGFEAPFDTWADMRQLIAAEAWPEEPGALAYFCSALPTEPEIPSRERAEYPGEMRDAVFRDSQEFLERSISHLWPLAARADGGFRWELLVAPDGSAPPPDVGRERLATQFWIANVNPSDRYVLSVPGSSKHRISPLDNTYDNLTIAGDWTDCGLNCGCVEAAVMSGLLAAHAISGAPRLEEIVGYDHP